MSQNVFENLLQDINQDINKHYENTIINAGCEKLGIPNVVDVEREREVTNDGATSIEKYVEKVAVDVAYVGRKLKEAGYVFNTSESVNPETRKLEISVRFYKFESDTKYRFDTKWESSVTKIENV